MRCPEEYEKQWRLNQGKLRQQKQKRREKGQKAREEGKDKGRTKKEKNHGGKKGNGGIGDLGRRIRDTKVRGRSQEISFFKVPLEDPCLQEESK